jgi:hypothetical protein
MPLSWNEIKTRGAAFVNDWKDASDERAEAQTFWNEFLNVFGISRRRVASFEEFVRKREGDSGFIDLFWPGVLVAEHKSRGKDLGAAFDQAIDYFPGLDDEQLPRYVIVSNFEQIRVRDLEEEGQTEFALTDLLDYIELFGFIAGYEKRSYDEEDPVNVDAAAKMGALHDELEEAGYTGHDLEVFLVRLLFCLFAEDTGIFTPRAVFQDYIENRTSEDGADLGPKLGSFFEVLNTPVDDRQGTLDEQLQDFPYVNGPLFRERLRTAHFDSSMRQQLLDACALDWGAISPAIFGAMFQGAMDPKERRQLGAHYTSEENIKKLIGPLFIDELWKEFERIKKRNSKPQLEEFHEKLAGIKLLDPACGCGNFLVIAYRELRRLEIEVIREIYSDQLERGQLVLDISELIKVNVDQCFGIEIEEFPAQIAQVALWLMDHQMNVEVAEAFGTYFTRLPLSQTAHIRNADALLKDWSSCFGEAQPDRFDYILGNPPFGGKKEQSDEQKKHFKAVMNDITGYGVLDFVTAWYIKAAQYMDQHPETSTAFVSTKSVSQGEQVGVLWNELFSEYGAKIHFAHRTFRWDNEASGRAAVHVVIIGYSLQDTQGSKRLFDYKDVRGQPYEHTVSNINPYLVEGNDTVVVKRRDPIIDVPVIREGNALIDWGYLVLNDEEAKEIRSECPASNQWIRPFSNGDDLINGTMKWCLWLVNADPQAVRSCQPVLDRIEKVKDKRQNSSRAATNRLADQPTLFGEIRQPESEYIFIPKTSSKNRSYIPTTIVEPEVIINNSSLFIEDSNMYHFGVLNSEMHMTWMRYTGGRLKSDYRYSNQIVYNNFPWPDSPGKKHRNIISKLAQKVLDKRRPYLDDGNTLADLYDPLAMPPDLVDAHRELDRAVDRAYRPQPFTTETNRVSFLFDRYEEITNALFAT